jgi:outer membrane protein OmpA-like peptidoglycan-associated protein
MNLNRRPGSLAVEEGGGQQVNAKMMATLLGAALAVAGCLGDAEDTGPVSNRARIGESAFVAEAGTAVRGPNGDRSPARAPAAQALTFAWGEAMLGPELQVTLDDLARAMRADPGTTLQLVGHADGTGDPALNEDLSRERAAAVKAYLVVEGVSEERIVVLAQGSSRPVASNATEAGRARNRRVEALLARSATED